jgi:hypothetical protein
VSAEDAHEPINVAPAAIAILEPCFMICSLKLLAQAMIQAIKQ